MDASEVTIPNNTKVFFELQECLVHGFVAHQKNNLAEGCWSFKLGVCKILEMAEDEAETPNDQKIYYIQV